MNNLRRNITVLLVLAVILALGLSLARFIGTRNQKLTVNFSSTADGFSASIYKAGNSSAVQSTNKTASYSLPRGEYTVIVGDGKTYRQSKTQMVLDKDAQTIDATPAFTETKLSNLLKEERKVIDTAIRSSVPGISKNYRVQTGKLHHQGEWYSTTIIPNLSREELRLQYVDIYRLVAKKENDTWKVVTIPPQLIVTTVAFPDIPRDVILDVNAQKL